MILRPPRRIRLDSNAAGRRWSFEGRTTPSAPVLWCEPDGSITRLSTDDEILKTWQDPLHALAWLGEDAADIGGGSRWVGYLSYDFGRFFERLPQCLTDDLGLPLFAFTRVEAAVPTHDIYPTAGVHPDGAPRPVQSNFTRDAYLNAVRRSIEYIAAGDVFQVNLAQRFIATMRDSPEAVYAQLQRNAPAPLAALLDFGDFALIGNSPELFLRVEPLGDGARKATNRPIKGTRPRKPGMDVELRDSIKDQAELHMIVDLERNDLGRVCEIGSVKVTEPRTIEAHPTVYHGVATIEGMLRRDVGFVDLLRATFPCGSITGAPKIRAMEVIDELEPVRRGPYCGAVGWLGAGGAMEFNVAIRTIIAIGETAYVSVGGGIVADSAPEAEYDETLVKAEAIFDALRVRADDRPS